MENYTHSALKIVVAQMCQVLGWNAMQPVTLEILVDLLHRYLMKLGSTTCEYALLANRTEPNLEDLFSTFHHMRINLEEMRSFVQHVEMPRSLANFPFKQKAVSKLKFDHCTSSDTYVCSPNERLQCIPSYMPPLSESSKEQREEDEESGFGDLSELDIQVGAHREETVGSHAEPPAPRPAPSPRSSSPRHDPPDDDVASKLETDLRLSEDEAQEPDQLIESHSPAINISHLQAADATPTAGHQTDPDLTFEPLPYSPPADYPTGVGEDWSNPPVTVEISVSQGLSPEDGVESADSTDSTSSDTDNEKIELILPETIQDPLLAPNTPLLQTSPTNTPPATTGESQTLLPTETHSATPVPTPDRIREGSKRLERLRRESEQRLERIGQSETCLNELITRQCDYTETRHESVSETTSDGTKNSVRLVLDRADTHGYPAPPTTSCSDLGTQSQATLPFKKRLRPSHDPLESTSSYDMTPNEGDRPTIRLSLSLKKTDTAEAPPSPLSVSIPLSTLSGHSPVKVVPKIKVKTPNKRPTIPPNHISIKKMKLSTDSVSDSHSAPLLVSVPLSRVSLLPPSTLVAELSSDVLDDSSSLQDPFPEVISSHLMEQEVREEFLSTPKPHKSKQIKSTSERSRKSSTSPKKHWSVVSIPLHKLDRKPVHPALRVESSLTSEVSSIERVDIGVGGHHEYLCPKCKNGYDGSLMICCDGNCTDTWYHGKCVGIFQAPVTDRIWYCPECRSNQTLTTTEHRRHKKHKKHRKYRQSYSEAVSDTEQCSSPSLTQES